ncbi:MAG TPA: hypothetical protein EYG68_02565 [Leucothrix mucor]|nr:hypothetical protein [Leucothrix mucor]
MLQLGLKRRLLGKIVFLFTCFFMITLTASAKYSSNPRLGTNVGSLDKLTSSVPFTDIFKISRGWFTSCEFDWQSGHGIDPDCTRKNSFNTREQNLLDLDANGWVKSLPAPQHSPVFTSVSSTWVLPEHFPLGRYVVLYKGQGTIKLTGDLRMVVNTAGHLEFDLLSPKRNLRLNISATNPQNYIREIRVVPKRNEHNYRRQIFNPEYIRRLAPLQALRFMTWSNTRGNDATEWYQRSTPASSHYSGSKGVPAERMIDLANAINATPWVSVPYKASDDYMRQYARMVKKRLRPKQKVYVEYSNEMWNTIFPATTYAARKADKLWNFPYADKPPYQRRVAMATNWYAKRTVEMCKIWKKEFGNQSHRVKCVLSAQSAVTWVGKETLDCPLWKEAGGCGKYVDAFAIGPYFGDYIARLEHRPEIKQWTRDADGGMDRLFREIEHGGVLKKGHPGGAIALTLGQYVDQNKKLADKYGLELLAYEAGQHLIRYDPPHTVKDPAVLNMFLRAQKDPRMQSAYQRYLNGWAQHGGGLLMHFYGIGELSEKNFFSMLDHTGEASTPKYAALMQYLGAPAPRYTTPARPAPPPIARAPAVAPAPRAPVAAAEPSVVIPQQVENVARNNPVSRNTAPANNSNAPVIGAGIGGWKIDGDKAISPPIQLVSGNKNELNLNWKFNNISRKAGSFFRVYAIDSRGGRKLLLSQVDADIAEVGNYDQLFIEDLNRYLGPPIQLMIQVRGLQAEVTGVTF